MGLSAIGMFGGDRGGHVAALAVTPGARPRFGSGPLATVVQDLLSLVIYFAIATAVLG